MPNLTPERLAEMKQIPLTQGLFALVDDADYDWLMQWKWHTKKKGGAYYAARACPHPTKGWKKHLLLFMHRAIMNTPPEMETDHINHDGLDNRRHNIRICSHKQNAYNQSPANGHTSKYKGVSLKKNKTGIIRWLSQIHHGLRYIHIGYFSVEEDAARAYDGYAKKLFGDYAYLNFPETKHA